MEKWIRSGEFTCADPTREKEFNDFEDNVHTPKVLKAPGYVAVTRYAIKETMYGRGEYLSIWEIESDDIDKTMAIRREMRKKEAEQGQFIIPGLLVSIWGDVLFRQIGERICSKLIKKRSTIKVGKWIRLGEFTCADPTREKEFNDFIDNVHIPNVLKAPGYVAVTRYAIKEPMYGRGEYLSVYEIESDDIDKTMAIRREMRKKEAEQGQYIIPGLLVPIWGDVLFRQIGERICSK